MDFKLKNAEKLRTVIAKKALATVIEAGDLVAISSGLIVKAGAADAKIAWCPAGAGDDTTDVEVTVGNDFTLVGTGDTTFALANKGAEVDLVVNSTNQQIDLGTSTTDVLLVSIAEDAGVVGSASEIEVRINPSKVLF